MIIGIGVDTVEIYRFQQWCTYSLEKLSRIFSQSEIAYCQTHPKKAAERFAVRFAAREAFFKAFQIAYPEQSLPFLSICKQVYIKKKHNGAPYIKASWEAILPREEKTPPLCTISLTHTREHATAWVLLEATNMNRYRKKE